MKGANRNDAFSLVELLVVMGIISVLAGLAVPAYINNRSHAYAMKCQANLRGIGLGMAQYSNTWGGWMPYALDNNVKQTAKNGKAVRWKYELSYFMGNYSLEAYRAHSYPLHPAFFDPIKGKGEGNYFISAAQFGESIWLYGTVPAAITGNYNNAAMGWYPYSQWTTKTVKGPNNTTRVQVRVQDYPTGYMFFGSWKSPETAAFITEAANPTLQRGYARDPVTKTVNVDYRHDGKANVLFLDCHMVEFGENDKSLYADPNGKMPGGCFDSKTLESPNMWQVPPALKGPTYVPPPPALDAQRFVLNIK